MNRKSIIDVVLVNWNSGEFLSRCLTLLLSNEWNKNHCNIIVVDNGSIDGSLQNLDENGLDIHIIRNSLNRGFGAACNQGINLGNAEYVLMLNLDVEVESDTLVRSIEFMASNKWIGVLGVRHTDGFGITKPSCSRNFKFSRALNELSGLSYLFPKTFHHATLMKDWDHNNSSVVDNVMGAYYLIRRSVLNIVGLFDNRFFVYMEDVDLSLRVRESGSLVYYNADISIIHHGNVTTNNVIAYRLYLGNRSRLAFAKKYWSQTKYFSYTILLFTLGPLVRILHSIIRLQPRGVVEVLKSYSYFISWNKDE